MKTNMNELKAIFPYPSVKPSIPRDYFDNMPKGWCHFVNVAMFKELIGRVKKPEMVLVDGGTWMGLSAWHLLRHSPLDSTVICIDTWAGSREHVGNPTYRRDLNNLWNTFIVNMWEDGSRIIPMKFDSVEGMRELKRLGVEPDLIYIDWSHEYEDVYDDVSTALALFPKAVICGDDLGWLGVRKALDRIGAECSGMGVRIIPHACPDGKGGSLDICWHIER